MTITSLILFFAILFFLVVVHELGHFLFAKWTKMRVDEFAFGFPPSLFSRKIGHTLYSFNLIPLGGYVKIFGENGLTEEERNKLTLDERKQLFGNKPIWARLLVLLGGVLFNVIAAIFLFAIAFTYGTKYVIPEEELQNYVGDKKLVLSSIDSKSTLFSSEAKIGDVVVAITANGKKISSETSPMYNRVILRDFIQENNNSEFLLVLKSEKSEILKEVKAFAKPGIIPDKKILGVEFSDVGFRSMNFPSAFLEATKVVINQIIYIFVSLYDLIKNMIFADAKVEDNLSGPIGLAVLTGKVSERGFDQIMIFAAMLSLSLAVFNFLPLPALDGGRIVFVLIEAITRKKVKVEIEQLVHGVGFLLLLVLMILISYYDIVKAFT